MRLPFACCCCFLFPLLAQAQSRMDSPEFSGTRAETYKTVGDVSLRLWVFEPDGHQATDKRPAIVFFFGGGWKSGSPGQFEPHCRYLASRGIVAMTADYRVRTRHGTLADRCVTDAKSAVRWVRRNAPRLGVDPNRIVAGGGSAGGHLAACTGVVPGFDEIDEDLSVSSVPNALALFNPAVLLASFQGVTLDSEKLTDLTTRTGVPPQQISPIHHVESGQPPTIIFHGKSDTTVPYKTVEKYAEQSNAAGNRCELKAYVGAVHGFFNHGKGDKPTEYYQRTLFQLDEFLASLGYVDGPPTIQNPESLTRRLRGDFLNSRIRFEREKRGSVVFLGGSITEMDGYRPILMEHLQNRFPETQFTFTNAGIASTCSTTGAFRVQRDVLSAKPDLLFVEFAVNDDQDAGHSVRECIRGMEGVLRHALTDNPNLDIVVTHFVNPAMLDLLQQGITPTSSGAHDAVAVHYSVTSSDLAREVANRITSGDLTWKVFGGTHPKPAGNRIAADLIIDMLDRAWAMPLEKDAKIKKHRLPRPIDPNSYFGGRLLDHASAELGVGWSQEVPQWSSLPGQLRDRYADTEMLVANDPGAELSLRFQGTALGAFVLAGPDAGTLEGSIDGEPIQSIDLYHRFSKGIHYPRTVMFAADLADGPHHAILRVRQAANAESKGTAVRVLHFVANESDLQ
ncbi:alpha/beta hydrolase fold domain-containing protein [Novipirellula artificiosorum]|uniref:alpha/beta hydrolase fold domain-containing protein n=1 Tax=Novipirellula artificiosorum TaxID=2528016 RepID=UPI001E2D9BD8|nr:alpha/beta hydrolase fold domain-containing protein [Novipirellula artificiosorum]